ncbi:MAG: hypothetical protein U1C47_20310, partial [Hydrogenophaga sp.]|nr:hypothetical protein [Hydrogenophaga sp.]
FGQGFEGALREHVVDFKFCGVLASLGIAMTAIGGGVVLVFSGWSGHRRPWGTAPRMSPGAFGPSSLISLRRAPWPPMTSLALGLMEGKRHISS